MNHLASRARSRVTLSQLRKLRTVIETGSIGRASRQLGITQSAASQAVSSLENLLGRKLLQRTRNGVEQTGLAEQVIQYAQVAFMATSRIDGLVLSPGARAPQILKIASVSNALHDLVSGRTREFQALHPYVNVRLFEGDHMEINEWVSIGVVDIGITAFASPKVDTKFLMK